VIFWCPEVSVSDPEAVSVPGCSAYLSGEASPVHLAQVVRKAAEQRCIRRQVQAEREPWRRWLVGESRVMQEVTELIRLVGPRKSTVLITGETGTGKELVARAIHCASQRATQPIVAVNCAALPGGLLEAELFGHTRGAFTGAMNQRAGRFELAHGTTLFLDEVGETPLDLQPKLLRALQEREIQRLGSSETIRVDCRVIAASNSDLLSAVRNKTFREDLLYRLQVVRVHVPPLRERREDIPLLVSHFVEKTCRLEDVPVKEVTRQALQRLSSYLWPGNVRQLQHAVEHAIALSGKRRRLLPCDFPRLEEPDEEPAGKSEFEVPDSGIKYEETMARIERMLLSQALQKVGGNKAKAAAMLGMKRTTLVSKVKALSDFAYA
jgi:DNA-binding NtrC family response regulator